MADANRAPVHAWRTSRPTGEPWATPSIATVMSRPLVTIEASATVRHARESMPSLTSEAHRALHGVRVLEFSQIVAGPFAGVVLSDLGADVVKVEPPEGEGYRSSGAVVPGESKRFQSLNRGKRSLIIDLQQEEGRALVRRIVLAFDVVLVNYRPGIPERWRLDYDTLKAINPGLIYVSITGFGDKGPMAGLGATDLVAGAY
ncbi:MAG: hypothetical protein EXR66_10385, partial [Dehalococcoidia bacterium]|nr:hypothetical protein [Dehalococcoidia bacterium]